VITIILENRENQIIEKIGEPDNREYLLQPLDAESYPILSEVSDCDNELIISEQMPQLVKELTKLRIKVGETQKHQINEIIRLARICETNKDYFLIFTPFAHLTNFGAKPTQ